MRCAERIVCLEKSYNARLGLSRKMTLCAGDCAKGDYSYEFGEVLESDS